MSPREDSYVTGTGWRVIGRKPPAGVGTPLVDHPLVSGDPEETLYGVIATVTPRARGKAAVEWILEAIQAQLGERAEALGVLRRDADVSAAPSRYGGFAFRHEFDERGWAGRLRWREVHPLVPGSAITTELTLEERRGFTRLGVRVTPDAGLQSVRGAVGAGHAQPGFLHALRDELEFVWGGGPVVPRLVAPGDEVDFVRSVLEARTRQLPAVVLSPTEEGDYLVDRDELAFTLMGRGRLYVFTEHPQTFSLTDTLGDKRLSCFFGALRAYMPGFTVHDDPYDHPLLVADRLTDPVMRAAMFGELGKRAGRDIVLPDIVPLAVPEEDPSPASRRAGSQAVAEADVDGEPPSAAISMPSGTGRGTEGPEPAPPMEEDGEVSPRAGVDGKPEGPVRTDDREAGSGVPAEADILAGAVDEISRAIRELIASNRTLVDEVERLRTLSAVRSASTSALERRMSALEGLLARFLAPDRPVEAATEEEGEEPAEDRYTLVDAVRDAADTHADTLLFLDTAFEAASESPYQDPERVRAILDAMARIVRKRRDGELSTSLREAFAEFGIDYRGGIAKSTPERLRSQYGFLAPDGQAIECLEHIALGQTYNPRRCLRIYFSSRVPAETRFVVGHVGRHFEVLTSS